MKFGVVVHRTPRHLSVVAADACVRNFYVLFAKLISYVHILFEHNDTRYEPLESCLDMIVKSWLALRQNKGVHGPPHLSRTGRGSARVPNLIGRISRQRKKDGLN